VADGLETINSQDIHRSGLVIASLSEGSADCENGGGSRKVNEYIGQGDTSLTDGCAGNEGSVEEGYGGSTHCDADVVQPVEMGGPREGSVVRGREGCVEARLGGVQVGSVWETTRHEVCVRQPPAEERADVQAIEQGFEAGGCAVHDLQCAKRGHDTSCESRVWHESDPASIWTYSNSGSYAGREEVHPTGDGAARITGPVGNVEGFVECRAVRPVDLNLTDEEWGWMRDEEENLPKIQLGFGSSEGGPNVKLEGKWIRPHRRHQELSLGIISNQRLRLEEIQKLAKWVDMEDEWTMWVEPIRKPWAWESVRLEKKDRIISRFRNRKEILSMGCFEESKESVQAYVPMFIVPKADGKGRIIADCREVNGAVPPPPKMKLPDIRNVVDSVMKRKWIVQYDARSYFYQFEVSPHARRHLISAVGGKRGNFRKVAWTVMPMGFSWAPGIAQITSEVIVENVRRRCPKVEAAVWVDNFFFAGDSREEVEEAAKVFKSVAKEVNMELKEDNVMVSESSVLLGVVMNLKEKSLRLKEEAVETAAREFSEWDNNITPRKFLKVLGAVMWHVWAVSREPMCSLLHTWHWLAERMGGWKARWDEKEYLPARVKDEINIHIGKMGGTLQWREQVLREGPIMYTDASEKGEGFVVVGDVGGRWAGGDLTGKIMGASIFIKELYAAVRGHLWMGPSVLVVDNQPMARVLLKGHSAHRGANALMQRYVQHAPPGIVWVPSHENWADGPSRSSSPRRVETVLACPQGVRWRAYERRERKGGVIMKTSFASSLS
jgi:hypothetical protein